METQELLETLGFKQAAQNLKEKTERNRKLHIAYQNHKFVTVEDIQKFNENLMNKTRVVIDRETKKVVKKIDPKKFNDVHYDKLVMKSVGTYGEIPPVAALLELQKAMDMNCFDAFLVAKIESIKEVVDPIIFGYINGCSDLFFITQWDNDVKVEDIINVK